MLLTMSRHAIWPRCAALVLAAMPFHAPAAGPVSTYTQLCKASPTARAHCSVLVNAASAAQRTGTNASGPVGYTPADLQSAYKIDTSTGAGNTVAIVGAYDAPHGETDLAFYRSQFGLPPCTSANGCFAKLNQNGGTTPLPATSPANDDWGTEYALQLDMVSATCSACNIVLVEADDDQGDGLYTSVNTAAALPGVVAISLPWGGPEDSTVTASEAAYFNHPGIAVVAAGGDNGYGVVFPASSRFVVSVGGTALSTAANARGWTEHAWSGTGSGCSAFIAKPGFQNDPGCSRRTGNDIAAVADPNTGVAVYSQGDGGWFQVGGTTVATGIIAGLFGLAGAPTFHGVYPAAHLYRSPASLFDVTSGSDGTCGGSYLCIAAAGYDGPTGNGTPNGVQAFVDDTVFADAFE